MQNIDFEQPVALGIASSGCIQAGETTLPGCRSVALACNRTCTGLQLQEWSSCVWRGMRAGQSLYQQSEPLHSIFVVRSGTFKSTLAMEDGNSRICAFPTTGEVIAPKLSRSSVRLNTATGAGATEQIEPQPGASRAG